MSSIDHGIKQPLRFWDNVARQNWRQEWQKNIGLAKPEAVLINPVNTIVPFQLRRRRSVSVITTFDLYSWNGSDFVYSLDLTTIVTVGLTTHMKIISMEYADNILWNPVASFTSDLTCGLHYVHVSDGTNNWYSEVFEVITDLDTEEDHPLGYYDDANTVGSFDVSADGTDGEIIVINNKPL